MSEQSPQDQAPNNEALVEAYTPEMLAAREDLVVQVDKLRQRTGAADMQNQLPPRVSYRVFDNDITIVSLGSYPEDYNEALSLMRTDKEFASITGSPDPSNNITVITLRSDKPSENVDTEMPVIEMPKIKIETSTQTPNKKSLTTLSIYPNGYVEISSESSNIEMVHSDDASDLVKTYAAPTIKKETPIIPYETKPADIEDIKVISAVLAKETTRYLPL
jgi:hypothetical protein